MKESQLQKILLESTEERFAGFRKRLKRCSEKRTEKRVHALRIAARRLIAALSVLAELIGSDALLKRTRKSARQVLKIFGPLRDLQIQYEYVGDLLEKFPELKSYKKYLNQQEKREIEASSKKLHQLKPAVAGSKFLKELKGLLDEKISTQSVIALLNRRFELVLYCKAALDPSAPETIHATRIAFKKFRYAWEIFHLALPAGVSNKLDDFKKIQSRMGVIQDWVVLQEGVSDFFKINKKIESAPKIKTEIEQRKAAAIQEFIKTSREIEKLWPLRVALKA